MRAREGFGHSESVQERARQYLKDPTAAQLNHGNPHTWPELARMWDTFRETWGREDRPSKSHDPRVTLALELFADGRTPEQLCTAIRNSRNYGPIARNRDYQRLRTILRDGEQVDNLLRLDRPETTKAPRQPNGNFDIESYRDRGIG